LQAIKSRQFLPQQKRWEVQPLAKPLPAVRLGSQRQASGQGQVEGPLPVGPVMCNAYSGNSVSLRIRPCFGLFLFVAPPVAGVASPVEGVEAAGSLFQQLQVRQQGKLVEGVHIRSLRGSIMVGHRPHQPSSVMN
jgi:hypothetical protein